MSGTDGSSGKKSGGRAVLLVSLAINLFLVGLIVGGIASGVRFQKAISGVGGGMPFSQDSANVRRVAQLLPPEMRQKLRKEMRAGGPDIRDAARDAAELRQETFLLLRTSPFDEEAYARVSAASREADTQVRILSQQVFENFVVSLDDDERAYLAAAIETDARQRRIRARQRRGDNRPDMKGRSESGRPGGPMGRDNPLGNPPMLDMPPGDPPRDE